MKDGENDKAQLMDEWVELRQRAAEVDRRYRAITQILSTLNIDLPIEDIVRGMGTSLRELIPCDRFGLGMVSLNRWYFLQDGHLTSKDSFWSSAPMREDYSATRWVILNKRPLLRRDISKERRFERDPWQIEELGMLSDLIVPLINVHVPGATSLSRCLSDGLWRIQEDRKGCRNRKDDGTGRCKERRDRVSD